MSTSILSSDVVSYVSAVRAHLDDLDATVVEDLTDGLTADLADLAAESSEPLVQRVGTPQQYADELRSAAGLPARRSAGRPGGLAVLRTRMQREVDTWRQHSWWPGVSGFVVSLRPAWWVLRGAVLAVAALVVGGFWAPVFLLLLVVAVPVSVLLGRGRWSGAGWVPGVSAVSNVVGVVLVSMLLFAGLAAAASVDRYVQEDTWSPPPGMSLDGEAVRNVYAYDAQGNLLQDVQLFDQDGRPLVVDEEMAAQWDEGGGQTVERHAVPATDAYGRPVWNVFPLRTTVSAYSDDGPLTPSVPSVEPPRALSVPPVVPWAGGPSATEGPTPGATPSAPPTAGPTTGPSVPPTGTAKVIPSGTPSASPSKPAATGTATR